MRRLCLTLLCGLVAVPAAVAASHATGDGVLEIKDGSGIVVLNTTRGTVWGQLDKGKLVVSDPLSGDGAVFVSGAEKVVPGVADNVTSYSGRDLHFRVTGGKARLWFKATGLNLTAVGVGNVQFTGDAFSDPGVYARDSGKWNPIPVITTSVGFGVQSAPAP
ncbi:MAG: hypothetical protein QOH16_1811 [Gaiellaceae bacterium]|jgi:hypothetical protein|nr:hypothetical protein [Gaiellaceae bacterium]